jgi:diguanylate cyclase (GGDEF)-like protein/PAS domain S-box-containing protein
MNERARLLIVDDMPDNRLILDALLGEQYDLLEAASGEEALALLERYDFDMILLDVVMPGIDGFEVCRRIKETPGLAEVPLLFVTSLDSAADEAQGLALGAADFIYKPFSEPVVLGRVHNHLQLARARSALARHAADLEREVEARTRELKVAATAFDSQQCMVITDADTVILQVNRAFTEDTGYSANEVIGRTTRTLKSGRHDKAFYETMWQAIIAQGHWQGEIYGRRKSGEIYPKSLTISAVKSDSGEVTHYVGTYVDISDQKRAEARIANLAFFDQLTGLPNRSLLADRFQQAVASHERSGEFGALLMLDLDSFKSINDTQGHSTGDLLLKEVALRLGRHTRQGDTLARLGGDEFVILLCGIESNMATEAAAGVERVAQKLLRLLTMPYTLAGETFHCHASIGIALYAGVELGFDDAMRQADLAMYQSKQAGGNSYHFFDPAMEKAALHHARIEADLRRAAEEDQFELYYQPLVDGQRGKIAGAEALIRWHHPERGMVPPFEFIGHAERTGLIIPIGYWVLETACQQLATWAQRPETAALTISVNVSAQQFPQGDFVEKVIGILKRTGADPRLLKIELTESMFAERPDEIIRKMNLLKMLGVLFSLDDFGTGYSSLSYLARMPLDQLKIDRSFVSAIESGDNNVTICAATISLAHGLDLKVVAEGVETDAQRYFLSTVHKCDLLQGYLFSKPVPISDFEKLLTK